MDPWAQEHFPRVPEPAGGDNAAKVEGREGRGVDLRGEGEWGANETVFVPCNQVGFPA